MGTADEWLVSPERLWSWDEISVNQANPPPRSGVYGWFFDLLPANVPTAQCIRVNGFTLAYVGIAPKAPPNGRPPSRQTLRSRIRNHFLGSAEGSTLRLTLGCLLTQELGLELRYVGSGSRLMFGDGEQRLSGWMREHARVVFHVCDQPWVLEERLISGMSLPLNLSGNAHHPFHPHLKALRAEHKARARHWCSKGSRPAG
jgi:hypothetical protein